MDLNVYHHFPPDHTVLRRLDAIQASLVRIERKENEIMSFATEMDAKITAETDAITAVELVQTKLLQELKDAIESGATKEQQLALLAKMDENKNRLAALAVQGTPAAG
jgi:hypothetical protein